MSALQSEPGLSASRRVGGNAADPPWAARSALPFRNRFLRRAMLFLTRRLVNRLMLRLAGGKHLTMLGVVQHRGRRSGRAYATPVGAQPTADGFLVPMTFGPRADWVQNVRAAGGCVIRWNGVDYPVGEPEVVDWAVARSVFPLRLRIMLRLFGMANFVRLRPAAAGGPDRG